MAAQIFAAVAATLSGPATSRNCMPSPVLLSFTTMIGRSVANEAVDFDLRSPRHSARRPLSELAPPTSTPNSVRCTACWAAAACDSFASGLSTDGADAVTSGLGGVTGSGSISFPAAESGAAMIDFDAMSGVAGVAAAFEIPCAGDEAATADCSGSAVRGFSGVAATVVATGDAAGAGPGLCGAGRVSAVGEDAGAGGADADATAE